MFKDQCLCCLRFQEAGLYCYYSCIFIFSELYKGPEGEAFSTFRPSKVVLLFTCCIHILDSVVRYDDTPGMSASLSFVGSCLGVESCTL